VILALSGMRIVVAFVILLFIIPPILTLVKGMVLSFYRKATP
jgi:hypothetical protein